MRTATPPNPNTPRGRRLHVTPSGLEVSLDRDAMTFFNRRAPQGPGRPAPRRNNPRAASAAAQIRPGALWL